MGIRMLNTADIEKSDQQYRKKRQRQQSFAKTIL
jgi:hypothetical protein